jgi:hypothetical protein
MNYRDWIIEMHNWKRKSSLNTVSNNPHERWCRFWPKMWHNMEEINRVERSEGDRIDDL